jgi:hypothetical protein
MLLAATQTTVNLKSYETIKYEISPFFASKTVFTYNFFTAHFGTKVNLHSRHQDELKTVPI